MNYFVTGASGFIGKRLVKTLLARPDATVYFLMRNATRGSRRRLCSAIGGRTRGGRSPVAGDLTKPGLGVADADLQALEGAIDHVFHLGAIYAIDADPESEMTTNVEGTRNARAIRRANPRQALSPCQFDRGRRALRRRVPRRHVRRSRESGITRISPASTNPKRSSATNARLPWRIYRPGIVVGDSRDGEMDKIDGPYYFFKLIQKMRRLLPPWAPSIGLEGGRINLVPVDFVARALDHLAHLEGQDGRCFHLTDPHPRRVGDILNIFARAAHAPSTTIRINAALLNLVPRGVVRSLMALTPIRRIRKAIMSDLALPDDILTFINYPTRFDCRDAERLLKPAGIVVPPLEDYAWRLWDYWERRLDPDLFVDRTLRGRVAGRVVLVTGGSSGIGLAAALKLAAAGGVVIVAARDPVKLEAARQEAARRGLSLVAKVADITDPSQCDALVKWIEAEHGGVDILINNAGRSIRRGIENSFDRLHDFERMMQVNYFGALRLTLGCAAGDDQEEERPCHQHFLDRHADQRAAIFRLSRVEGRARSLDPLRRLGISRSGRGVHHDQHAAGAHRDDRADEVLRTGAGAQPGRGRGFRRSTPSFADRRALRRALVSSARSCTRSRRASVRSS